MRTKIDPSPALGLGSLTLALALVLCSPALAQDPGQQDPGQQDDDRAQTTTTVEKSKRRILHLHGGTTLRAVTRRVDDRWEYKQKGEWRSLPVTAVERAVSEREALLELKGRQREAGPLDLDARSRAAGWALDNGLLKEGLNALEVILREDPDQSAAREVLTAHAHRFRVPRVDPDAEPGSEDVLELLRWCAQGSATSRELGLLELARVRDREGIRSALRTQLFSNVVTRRSLAALALRRLFPGREVKALIQRAVLDSSAEVRLQSSLALRASSRVGVIVPVVKALDSGHVRVSVQAAEALGVMGYAAAVEPLMTRLAAVQGGTGHSVPHSYVFFGKQFAFIQDFDVEVAQFQAVADPQINVLVEGSVLEAGVQGIKDVRFVGLSRAIRGSLGQLTGANPGRSVRDWLGWWERNQGEWRTADLVEGLGGER
ncbi:MAG: HEAT repeat domain-containing protein [Planctomycetota bacterium]